MSQATMTKPSTSAKSTYDPYASMDGQDASASSYQADSVPAEPQYKLVIDDIGVNALRLVVAAQALLHAG